MPTYDYQCEQCGHAFEAVQGMRDNPLRDCPSCGEPQLRRLISGGAGVIFRGSGFYVTDSRKSSSTLNGKGKKDAGSTDGGSSTSSDKSGSGTGSDTSTSTSKSESKTESKGSGDGGGGKSGSGGSGGSTARQSA